MRNSLVHLAFSLTVLVGCGAAEEFLPKILGVGFPLLLASVQFMATVGRMLDTVLFAVAAGAIEDALSSLPMMTSSSFFLAVALLIHWAKMPRTAMAFTYLAYQIWLAAWVPLLRGSVYSRMLVAIPIGCATAFAVFIVFAWVRRRAAVGEQN